MAKVVPPFGTSAPAGWNKTGAATLHEAVSESVASADGDTSYISCSDGTACELELDDADHPNRTDGHIIRLSSKKAIDTSQVCTLRVELYCGATLIATLEFDQTASYAVTELTLTDAEAAAITNYGDLKFVLTDVASPLTAEHRVTALELELPDRTLHAYVSG